MGIIPWRNKRETESATNELSQVNQLRNEIDRLFERFISTPWSLMERDIPSWFSSSWMPVIDISETDKEVTINLEAPGMDSKDIELSISGKTLTIQGEKKEEKEENGKNVYKMERRFGSFRRSVDLPEEIDENSINAEYKNGLITIKANKVQDKQRKKIQITKS